MRIFGLEIQRGRRYDFNTNMLHNSLDDRNRTATRLNQELQLVRQANVSLCEDIERLETSNRIHSKQMSICLERLWNAQTTTDIDALVALMKGGA